MNLEASFESAVAEQHRPTGPRVSIFGAVGTNLGDEAIALAVASALRQTGPELDVSIGNFASESLNRRYSGLREFSTRRSALGGWLAIIQEIRASDVVLIGGGTIVQDKLGVSPLKGMLAYATQIALLARAGRRRLHTLPIGVDELNTSMGRRLAKIFLNSFTEINVRDERSRSLAQHYAGDAGPAIRVVPDPAFLLSEYDKEAASGLNGLLPPTIPPDNYIAISLVRERTNVSNFLPAVGDLVGRLIAAYNCGIVLVPMDRHPSEEVSLFRELLESLPEGVRERVYAADPSMSCFAAARILRGARLVLAMRLHAMILALGAAPVVAMSRTTKTDTFAKDWGIPCFSVDRQCLPDEMFEVIVGSIDAADRRAADRAGRDGAIRDANDYIIRLTELLRSA